MYLNAYSFIYIYNIELLEYNHLKDLLEGIVYGMVCLLF